MPLVDSQPLALPIRTEIAANLDALVPLQAKPAKVLEDGQLRFARRTLGVGVLDAEDERPVVPARKEPVEQRRARVADVQVAGWGWGETDSHRAVEPDRDPAAGIRRTAVAIRHKADAIKSGHAGAVLLPVPGSRFPVHDFTSSATA